MQLFLLSNIGLLSVQSVGLTSANQISSHISAGNPDIRTSGVMSHTIIVWGKIISLRVISTLSGDFPKSRLSLEDKFSRGSL